jgi:hypothetical protein
VTANLGPGKTVKLSDDTKVSIKWGVDVHDVSRRDLSAGTLGNSLGDLLDLGAGDEEGDVEHVVTESLIPLASSFLTRSIRRVRTE